MAVPRMRTIKQAIAELKAADNSTAFTESALRRAITSGDIPHIRAGNKILVNLDTVESYLSGELITADKLQSDKLRSACKIRALG